MLGDAPKKMQQDIPILEIIFFLKYISMKGSLLHNLPIGLFPEI